MLRFLPVTLFFLLALFLYFALREAGDTAKLPSPLRNKPAPALNLPLLDTPGVMLRTEELRGQVWLLNVWASWCAACLDEHPLLLELAQMGVPVIGLNYKDNNDDAKQWLARYGNPYQQVVVDAQGAVGLNWGVYGVPETFIIDAQGIVQEKFIGPLSAAMVKTQIRPWFTGGNDE